MFALFCILIVLSILVIGVGFITVVYLSIDLGISSLVDWIKKRIEQMRTGSI